MRRFVSIFLASVLAFSGTACLSRQIYTWSNQTKKLNGMTSVHGGQRAIQTTTTISLTYLGIIPVMGSSSTNRAAELFTDDARKSGASKFNLIQKESTIIWPLAVLLLGFTPVWTEISGEVH